MVKMYPGLSEEECYEVYLNKICRSFEFKSFISSKHKICPNGLTISCGRKADGTLGFFPQIKYYGYDHAHNNGMAYSDMGDYMPGPPVDEDMINTIYEYLKINEKEIYDMIIA